MLCSNNVYPSGSHLSSGSSQSLYPTTSNWPSIGTSTNYDESVWNQRWNVDRIKRIWRFAFFSQIYDGHFSNRDILHPFITSEPLSKYSFSTSLKSKKMSRCSYQFSSINWLFRLKFSEISKTEQSSKINGFVSFLELETIDKRVDIFR